MKTAFVSLLLALMVSSCLSTRKHGEVSASGKGQADVTLGGKVTFEKKDGKIVTTRSGSADGQVGGSVAGGYMYGGAGSSSGNSGSYEGEVKFGKGKPDEQLLAGELAAMHDFEKHTRDDFSRETFDKLYDEYKYKKN